ncbi:MAG: DUF4442 domain-containing protein [Pseudoxanthomonas sp.]
MDARLFRLGLNLWPPFLCTGIRVTSLAPDYSHAAVELRMRPWNRNYVGTHFGGSLFAMTDPFWMLLLMQQLGRDHYVWDKAAAIEFVKPGRGTVGTRFDLDPAIVAGLRTQAAGGDKVLHWFESDITDAQGELVARVRKQVYLRLKPRERAAARSG